MNDQTTDNTSKLALTPAEAAELAGVKEHRIRTAIRDKSLRSLRFGKVLRVAPEDLRAWVLAHRQPRPEGPAIDEGPARAQVVKG
jgi:excisionase family DNA binding protein